MKLQVKYDIVFMELFKYSVVFITALSRRSDPVVTSRREERGVVTPIFGQKSFLPASRESRDDAISRHVIMRPREIDFGLPFARAFRGGPFAESRSSIFYQNCYVVT